MTKRPTVNELKKQLAEALGCRRQLINAAPDVRQLSTEAQTCARKRRQYATRLVESGLSVIPIRSDGSKVPVISWKEYQTSRATKGKLRTWFDNESENGIGIVCGPSSGNLIALDFKDVDTFIRLAGDCKRSSLADALLSSAIVKTPRGFHVIFRLVDTPPAGKRLATEDNKILIETRGTGHCIVSAGSPADCHESGELYKLINGDLTKLPVLNQKTFQSIIEQCTALDRSTLRERQNRKD
jgi:hypothetical protein